MTGISITVGFGSHLVIDACIRQWRVVHIGWMAGLGITGSVVTVPVNPSLQQPLELASMRSMAIYAVLVSEMTGEVVGYHGYTQKILIFVSMACNTRLGPSWFICLLILVLRIISIMIVLVGRRHIASLITHAGHVTHTFPASCPSPAAISMLYVSRT